MSGGKALGGNSGKTGNREWLRAERRLGQQVHRPWSRERPDRWGSSEETVAGRVAHSLSDWEALYQFWIYFLIYFLSLFLKRFYLFILEGKVGRNWGRETSVCCCLSCAPYWGPGLQPRRVPWLGIEPATLWFTGWCSSIETHQPGLFSLC